MTGDLKSEDLDRLVRLIRVFVDDLDYEVRPEHVQEQWKELAAEDAGHGKVYFDNPAEYRKELNDESIARR